MKRSKRKRKERKENECKQKRRNKEGPPPNKKNQDYFIIFPHLTTKHIWLLLLKYFAILIIYYN